MQTKMLNWMMFLALTLATIVISSSGFAAATKTPLPADQAFAFNASLDRNPSRVLVNWQIAPGYYLYTKRIHIMLEPKIAASIRLPQGNLKYDANLGRLEVYSGDVSVPVLLKTHEKNLILSVDYQGCSEEGFCYPPMQKNMLLNLTDGSVSQMNMSQTTPSDPSFKSLLTNQNSVRDILSAQKFGMLLLIFAGLGLLLAFTPCVLPMIPILTGIIVGQKQSVTTRKAFFLSLTYVLGAAITYAIAGIIAASMGNSLQASFQKPWILGLVAGIFVLLAFSLFGYYELRLPSRLQNRLVGLSNRQQGGTYIGVFLMGMISTLIVSPCVKAPLVGVLMYIAQTGDRVLGASALFAMGIGMGIPLLLIGMSAGKWLPKSGPWMEIVKKTFGVLMLGMAAWLLSRMAHVITMKHLLGILLLGVAIFLIIYLPRILPYRRFSRLFGIAFGCCSVLVMFGGITIPTPMNNWMDTKHTMTADNAFIRVRDVDSFNKQLLLAQAAHKPVILDFYADWCESCIVMDRNVFKSNEVERALSNYVLLRADLTANSDADQALLKYFDVIAPPTVLFFDTKGVEMNSQRIVGEVDAHEFLSRLDHFRDAVALK